MYGIGGEDRVCEVSSLALLESLKTLGIFKNGNCLELYRTKTWWVWEGWLSSRQPA